MFCGCFRWDALPEVSSPHGAEAHSSRLWVQSGVHLSECGGSEYSQRQTRGNSKFEAYTGNFFACIHPVVLVLLLDYILLWVQFITTWKNWWVLSSYYYSVILHTKINFLSVSKCCPCRRLRGALAVWLEGTVWLLWPVLSQTSRNHASTTWTRPPSRSCHPLCPHWPSAALHTFLSPWPDRWDYWRLYIFKHWGGPLRPEPNN